MKHLYDQYGVIAKARILEYLGGIETINYILKIGLLFMILEYLGGIETTISVLSAIAFYPDFRIPRRDWNDYDYTRLRELELKILEYLGGIETCLDFVVFLWFFMILEYLGGIETLDYQQPFEILPRF